VQLSDTDVESVIRKTVLRKKPEQESPSESAWKPTRANWPATCRHALAATHEDEKFFVADYPLLPTRRRFWEKVLRNTDHSGTKAQLRSQLQIVFEATRQTAAAAVGTVVPADFIYDQISTDLLNSGELEREYDEIIRKQRDGTPDGELRSSLCALIFLIGKLPRTPGADDGVRANGRNPGGPAGLRPEERPPEAGATSAQAAQAPRRLRPAHGGGNRVPPPDARGRGLDTRLQPPPHRGAQ
jgi:hypothetical protein